MWGIIVTVVNIHDKNPVTNLRERNDIDFSVSISHARIVLPR